jgi:hypothetical protein
MRASILCFPVLVASSISCGDSTAPTRPPVPAALEIVSGDAQEGTVGTELSDLLRVRALDAKGHAIEGQVVNFLVTAGGGTLSTASSVTNSDGLVENHWTIGKSTADNQTVEARLADKSGGTPLVAVFHATPLADAPDTVRLVSGDGQSGDENTAFTDSLLVRVSDHFGNPVAGVTVSWSSSSGIVTLGKPTDITTATGYARTKITAGSQPGDLQIAARVGALAATFNIRVKPVATFNELVGRHVLESVAGVTVPTPLVDLGNEKFRAIGAGALEILANGTAVVTEDYSYYDVNGGRFIKAVGTVVPALKGDSLTLPMFDPLSGVVSTTTITLNGSFSIGRGGPRIYSRNSTPTALPAAGRGTSVAIVSGDNQRADAGTDLPLPLVVRVIDAEGIPVAGQSVIFWVVLGTGRLANGVATERVVTDADGLAQVTWTLGTTEAAFVFSATTGQSVLAMIVSSVDGLLPPSVGFSAVAVNH